MNRTFWYKQGGLPLPERRAEAFAESKAVGRRPEWAQRIWNQDLERSDLVYMTATFGDENAELPDGYVTINTAGGKFGVTFPAVEPDRLGYSMSFRMVRPTTTDVASGFDEGSARLEQRRRDQLMVVQLHGTIAGTSDPAEMLTVNIRPDGHITSLQNQVSVRDGPTRLVDYSPWPGLSIDDDRLWVDYPDFDNYDELIDRAQYLFDFFLAGPDPRDGPPIPQPKPRYRLVKSEEELQRLLAERENRTPTPSRSISGRLYWVVARDRDLSDEELQAAAEIARAMPEVRGERLEFVPPSGKAPEVLMGSSEVWPYEPVDDMVADVQTKLNTLTALRHLLPDTEWEVRLEDIPVPWNEQTKRFETP